jgi:hypothetical protein
VRRLGFALVLLLLTAACTRAEAGEFVQPRVVSEPLGGRTSASFSLDSGATTVSVHTADLGNKLYRAATPDSSGMVPRGTISADSAELRLVPSNEPGSGAAVDLKLSNKVAWNLRLAGGATTETVDLRGIKLSGLRVTGGVGQLEIWLPPPTGQQTVEISGGASGVRLHLPAGTPTQVEARAGAGSLTIDGVVDSGIGAGQVWTPDGWTDEQKRYDVDLLAGVGWLTLDRI